MPLVHLFDSLRLAKGRSGGSRRNRSLARRWPSLRIAPRLDALEDRALLSTLTVANSLDHGTGSLRAAIASAASGDRIVFAASVHNITLTTGELEITKSLKIDGPGAQQLAISGNNASRVFSIGSGAAVTIDRLTIANGQAGTGGGIDNAGSLTLKNAVVSNNQAVGGLGGGGVVNEAGANLLADTVAFTGNQATVSASGDVFGGGLLNEGTAVVNSCLFLNNTVAGGASLTIIGGTAGGGIDNFHGGSLSVTASTFLNNQSVAAAGPYFGLGGALDNNAGPNGDVPSTATVANCVFAGNLATGGAGVTGNGGAIDNIGTGSTLSVVSCVVAGNRSVGGDGGNGESELSDGLGGGIMNQFGAALYVTGSVITNNLAQGGNNATVTADNPLTGDGAGGGIYNLINGSVTVTASVIDNNEARGGTTASGAGGSALGGGIGCFFQCTLSLTNCDISNNLADAGHGTSGASTVPAGIAAGGGIDLTRFSTGTVTNCIINNNTAVGGTGGSGANGGTAYGGGLDVGLNVILGFDDGSSLAVSASAIDHNRAIGGTGGAGANGGNALGGGIAIIVDSSATINAGRIEYNSAQGGQQGTGGSDGLGIGGGVNNGGSFIFDAATVIKHNHASTSNDDIFP